MVPAAQGARREPLARPRAARLGRVRYLLVEAIGSGMHLVGHGGAAGVAGVFDDDELGAGPGAGELPRGAGAAAEVVAAVDQDAGDAGQLAGLADQLAVLQETVVREVVRADAHERQLRVVGPVAVRAGAPVAFLRDDRVLPGQTASPPRPAAQQPLLHAKVLAQLLHVPEQVPGRVQAHVSRGVAGVRQAAAAVALVEDDDPELLRVEGPPVSRRAPRPRSAVHDQRWHAIRVPAGLPVHEVPVTRVQQTALIRLDIRIPRHTKKAIGPAPHLDQAPGLRHRFPHNPWRGGSGLVGAGAAPNIPVRPHTEAVDGQGAGRLACRYVGHMAGSPSTGPVVRAVITMLCTWGCGRPCGPWWCSKEAATQRWGLTGENRLRPASCRNLSAA